MGSDRAIFLGLGGPDDISRGVEGDLRGPDGGGIICSSVVIVRGSAGRLWGSVLMSLPNPGFTNTYSTKS